MGKKRGSSKRQFIAAAVGQYVFLLGTKINTETVLIYYCQSGHHAEKKNSSLVKNRKRISGLHIHMIYMHHHARAAFKTKRIAVGRAGVKGTQPAKASWIIRLVAVGPSALAMRDRCREDGRAGPASTSPFGRFGQERDGPHKQLVLHGPARPLCCAFLPEAETWSPKRLALRS